MRRHLALAAVLVAAACAAPAPSPTPGLAHFDDPATLSFDYPDIWNEMHSDSLSSHVEVIVYLSTQQLPISQLAPDSLFVTWTANSFLLPAGSSPPSRGGPRIVGGRSATYGQVDVAEYCPSIGADVAWAMTTDEWVPANWNEMLACLRGPNVDPLLAQIDAMLATVEWHQDQ